jgi:hypothetical protein
MQHSCTKGHHAREMNYSVRDPNFVRNGQKAMIMISDHLVERRNAGKRPSMRPDEHQEHMVESQPWIGGSEAGGPDGDVNEQHGGPKSPRFG